MYCRSALRPRAWGPAIAFHFLIYRKDLAAYKKYEAEERLNITHF